MTRTHLTSPALAEQAAEAVRALNHRTIDSALPIDQAYAVLGELTALAHRLDQLTSQLGRGLHHRLTGPGYRLDHDGHTRWADPATAIAAAADALDQAATVASQLGALIGTAHQVAAHLIDNCPTDTETHNDQQPPTP